MIENEEKSQPKYEASFMKICQPPSLYKRNSKTTAKIHEPLKKRFNSPQHSPLSINSETPKSHNLSFVSSPERSIEQIKGKIQEYLVVNSEMPQLCKNASDLIHDISRKTTQEQFRISIFKNNNRKRISLKMIQEMNPERYKS